MNVEEIEAIIAETPAERAAAMRQYHAAKVQYAADSAVAKSDRDRLIAATDAWADDPEMIEAAEHDSKLPRNVGRTGTAIIAAAIEKRKAEIAKDYDFLDGGPVIERPAENPKLDAFRRSLNGGSL